MGEESPSTPTLVHLRNTEREAFMKLIAQTLAGLEPVLARELEALGASQITAMEGEVSFEGDRRILYRANLELRTALKILYPVATFRAQTDQHLYDGINHIDWRRYLEAGASLAVDADCVSTFFPKNGAAALRCRDAIGDRVEKRYGERPSIDSRQPDTRVHLSIRGDFCQISLDSSGTPLNNRGYGHEALDHSLNEVLAAGMLLLSGWKGETDFTDPMCGSGTLLMEAAMLAWNIPPLMNREYFGFKKWSNFDAGLWEEIKGNARENMRTSVSAKISGFDSAFQALRTTERNIQSARLVGKVIVERLSLEKQKVRNSPGMIMMCPPSTDTLKEEEIPQLYKQIGELVRKKCVGSTVYILISSDEVLKYAGLGIVSETELSNGTELRRLVRFVSD